jgi:hypothetical protein
LRSVVGSADPRSEGLAVVGANAVAVMFVYLKATSCAREQPQARPRGARNELRTSTDQGKAKAKAGQERLARLACRVSPGVFPGRRGRPLRANLRRPMFGMAGLATRPESNSELNRDEPAVRLWSLHPKYLDVKGLVALWREGLLARKVLVGKTRGYRHHPQLERFRGAKDPLVAIDGYLSRILDEAHARGYRFDESRIHYCTSRATMPVTRGQLAHEWHHLCAKLARRSPLVLAASERSRGLGAPTPHPCFRAVAGPIEPWERVPQR